MMSLPSFAQGQLVINEIMQSNVDVLFADKEFPDSWVEIYNAGETPVDLKGYKLGTSEKSSKAYGIASSLPIPPKGHGVIYCDKTGEGIHADFRLESTKKGSVYLFAPSGEVVDYLD
ncbi:MAG: lamin tail domain-containing protein, partial [Muribaculum sp.]|nr:lamin tail domain-containing protein [Muribaculum sp.]